MTTMTKTRGCGCGGKTSGGCGCGGKSAPATTGKDIATVCAPCDEAAFVRPQFFAGQLLTEDDLTALETYVIGKNRLHNAKLFGEGVVCGLEVSCGPCGGTTVRIAPGYALDCCGNDLVLTCDREIDIKPLIVALREQNHGKGDCGNPCDPPKSGEAPHTFEYCLYLRYTETASEPIASYPSTDDCTVSCQPTRVREGVAFELRCAEPPVRDDIVTALEACLGRLSSPDRVTGDGRTFETYSAQVRRALPLMDRSLDKLDTAEARRWTDRQPDLVTIADHATSSYSPTGDELVQWTELLVDVGGLYLRQASNQDEAASTPGLAIEYIAQKLETPSERSKIGSALDQIAAEEAALAYRALGTSAHRREMAYSDKLFLHGALMTRRLRGAYIQAAQELRGKLLQALGCDGGDTSDCTLYDDVRSLSLPSAHANEREVEAGDAADFATYGSKLAGYVKRFFMDCICRAFNPPCRSCGDDTAVLLACLKVRDCQVIEVCNMARTFVLSPSAMRYWLPPISWLGDVLAKLCCPSDDCGGDITKGGTDTKARFFAEMLRNPSASSAALVLPAFYHSGAYLPSLVAATRSFGDLAARRLLPGDARIRVPAFENVGRMFREREGAELGDMNDRMADLHARMDAMEAKLKKGGATK